MEAGLRHHKSKSGSLSPREFAVDNPSPGEKKGKSPPDEEKKSGTAISGLLVYLGLVLFAYCLGMAIPNKSKSMPVPSHKRTACKQKPENFHPEEAQGKKVLITGAAGFIGSYLARYGFVTAGSYPMK
jgi:hypothetical protein